MWWRKCPTKSWTYINTDGLVDYIDGEYYCDDCQSDAIRVVLQSELFNEVKEKKNVDD